MFKSAKWDAIFDETTWHRPSKWLLTVLILYYCVIISFKGILSHELFHTSAFDIGLHSQASWLLSRLMAPVTTIMGINVFGDHLSFYTLALAPFVRIFESIYVLYIMQAIWLGLGAIPVFLLARAKLQSTLAALIFGLIYLLFPALQNMNLENFHPETAVLVMVLFALYFLEQRNWKCYLLFSFLACIGKEDVALSFIPVGLYVAVWLREWKWGLLSLGLALSWFFLGTQVLMPFFLGLSNSDARPMVFSHWFGGAPAWKYPIIFLSRFWDPEALKYFYQLCIPVAMLNLLSPRAVLFLAVPFGINAVSGVYYFRSINYHYNYVTTAFVFYGAILGSASIVRWLPFRKIRIPALAIILVATLSATLIANTHWSLLPFHRHYEIINAEYQYLVVNRVLPQKQLVAQVPEAASISSPHYLVPHLSHRREIYMFPNPFRLVIWNQHFQAGKNPRLCGKDLDYLVLSMTDTQEASDKFIHDYLLNSIAFEKIRELGGLVLLRSRRAREEFGVNGEVWAGEQKFPAKVSSLFFPESNFYLRDLMGNITIERPTSASFSGYFFIAKSEVYSFRIRARGKGEIKIGPQVFAFDGGAEIANITLEEGPHSFELTLKNENPPYQLELTRWSGTDTERTFYDHELASSPSNFENRTLFRNALNGP